MMYTETNMWDTSQEQHSKNSHGQRTGDSPSTRPSTARQIYATIRALAKNQQSTAAFNLRHTAYRSHCMPFYLPTVLSYSQNLPPAQHQSIYLAPSHPSAPAPHIFASHFSALSTSHPSAITLPARHKSPTAEHPPSLLLTAGQPLPPSHPFTQASLSPPAVYRPPIPQLAPPFDNGYRPTFFLAEPDRNKPPERSGSAAHPSTEAE